MKEQKICTLDMNRNDAVFFLETVNKELGEIESKLQPLLDRKECLLKMKQDLELAKRELTEYP